MPSIKDEEVFRNVRRFISAPVMEHLHALSSAKFKTEELTASRVAIPVRAPIEQQFSAARAIG